MTRDDVERITENVLRSLSLRVEGGRFYDPNERTVILMLNDVEITRASFDVVQEDD